MHHFELQLSSVVSCQDLTVDAYNLKECMYFDFHQAIVLSHLIELLLFRLQQSNALFDDDVFVMIIYDLVLLQCF